MSEILIDEADFGGLLKDVTRRGWAFVPSALTRPFLTEVQAILPGLAWKTFVNTEEVFQEFEVATLYQACELPSPIDALSIKLGQLVRQHAGQAKLLRDWQACEIAVQRYGTTGAGIGRHRDYSADQGLIAVFTVQGSGKILIYPDRYEGEATHCLETAPGSMMLLAGTGLLEDDAQRPTHSVEPAICLPRTSMAFRMPVGTKPGGGDDYS